MLNLKPFEVCPYGDSCKFRKDAYIGICHGIKSDRAKFFVCDLVEDRNARNNEKLSSCAGYEEEKGR
jgi:hypothetical protein